MKKMWLMSSMVMVLSLSAAPKNVILFIGDGMSVPQRMSANEFAIASGRGSLAMNAMPITGMARTRSANSLVTDSAAAATAIACGVKTKNGYSGVGPNGERVSSCAELAKRAGLKVGIVSTVTISHATPAGFYAHRNSRGDTYGIAIDLANSGFDLFAGGGIAAKTGIEAYAQHPDVAKCGDAYRYVEKCGYQLISNRTAFAALKPGCGKVVASFVAGAMPAAIDSDKWEGLPTLAEITAKSIELLDNERGFFLMCEGGRIDWAGHSNDAATNMRDLMALDDAVRVALEFQKKHPDDTLVVVTGDHETGGLTMGFAGTGYALYPERLAWQKVSIGVFDSKVKDLIKRNRATTFDMLKPMIAECFGFRFQGDAKADPAVLTDVEIEALKTAADHDIELYWQNVAETKDYMATKKYQLGNACRTLIAHKSGLDWTSGSHTALPAMTTAIGCEALQFSGFYENSDIGQKLKAFYPVTAR